METKLAGATAERARVLLRTGKLLEGITLGWNVAGTCEAR